MRLKSEVFDQPQFARFSQASLILVEVDFPRHKALAPVEQAANMALSVNLKSRVIPASSS